MGQYILRASQSTVQVLSPQLVIPALFCTIETTPSGVIASLAVDDSPNVSVKPSVILQVFNDNIETIMALGYVIAGQGQQILDETGLLTDQVVFTVQYVTPATTNTSITQEATVPVDLLASYSSLAGNEPLQQAEAIVAGVYEELKNTAGG